MQIFGASAIVPTRMRLDRRGRRISLGSLILVGLALAGSILGAASIPHNHDPGRPGAYNQEHDLSYLATFSGGGLLPDAPSAVPLVVAVVLAVAIAAAVPPDLWRRHADFRAPPLS